MSSYNVNDGRYKQPGQRIKRQGLIDISVNPAPNGIPIILCEDCDFERDGSCKFPKMGKVATECDRWQPLGCFEPVHKTKASETLEYGI